MLGGSGGYCSTTLWTLDLSFRELVTALNTAMFSGSPRRYGFEGRVPDRSHRPKEYRDNKDSKRGVRDRFGAVDRQPIDKGEVPNVVDRDEADYERGASHGKRSK